MATHSYNPSPWVVEVRESDAKGQPGILETLISKATKTAGKASLRHPESVGNERWGRGTSGWVPTFVSAHTHPLARPWVNRKDLASVL